MGEPTERLRVKLLKLATALGKEQLRELSLATREALVACRLTKIPNAS